MKNLIDKILQLKTILVIVVFFIITAIFNSFMFVGIIEDGHHHFWEALICDNPFVGHEGFSNFPYNSRLFPSFLSHCVTGLLIKLGFLDLSFLLFVFTFISYISPALFLIIIYINIPKIKNNNFEIIVLSFLISLTYMIYQIWTENLITGLFLWCLFVIYYYIDFKHLSLVNFFCLIIFAILIISSHPMVVLFIPILLTFSVKKYIKSQRLKILTHIILNLSFILLITAFVFNIYYILHPIFRENDYFEFARFINIKFVLVIISIILIILISLLSEIRYKKIMAILLLVSIITILRLLLFNVNPSICFSYRTLGFYCPLFFMISIISMDNFKISINYKYFKILNLVLILIILVNSIYYAISWKRYLNQVNKYISNNQKINLVQIYKYDIYHVHSMPFIFIYVLQLYNNTHMNTYLSVKKSQSFLLDNINEKILKNEEKLKKFHIDVKKLIEIE